MADTKTDEPTKVERLVRYGLVDWTDTDARSGNLAVRYGYRGQTVRLPDHEAERINRDHPGALVSPNVELSVPGELPALPPTPSDQEIIAWVSGATPAEIRDLMASREDLVLRIRGAQASMFDRSATEHMALERAAMVAEGADDDDLPDPYNVVEGDDFVIKRPTVPQAHTGDYADVLAGSGEDVAAYIADHPSEADAVLKAETDRAGGRARRAIEAAAAAAKHHS